MYSNKYFLPEVIHAGTAVPLTLGVNRAIYAFSIFEKVISLTFNNLKKYFTAFKMININTCI